MSRNDTSRPPLNVYLTVDTEVWPRTVHWRESCLQEEIEHFLYGGKPGRCFGVPLQMEMLNRFGLKAVFFVESLFASIIGFDPLCRIIDAIQAAGHEVQLHIHTEWLERMEGDFLQGRTGIHMKEFSEDEQVTIVTKGIENLSTCGAKNVCAFRAGNFGANFDTLRALARNGVTYDSSHNTCYLDTACAMSTPKLLIQPVHMHGVYEFPVSFFRDYPGHYRPIHLTACSFEEIEFAIVEAWRQGWYAITLVLHSFELLKYPGKLDKTVEPDSIVLKRLDRLCQFLGNNKDRFYTGIFSELQTDTIPVGTAATPLVSHVGRTGWRVAEQAMRRIL